MTTAGLSLPTKACHNCRRKRWKCDRSLPVCQKCRSSGSECLGYGKLFIWNQGVASRGKMMGKSFDDSSSTGDGLPSQSQEQVAPGIGMQNDHPELNGTLSDHFGQPFAEPSHNHESPDLTLARHTGQKSPRIHLQLTDPLLQHLNSCERDYLCHFTTRLCADMVAYDIPGQNPWRDLVPATASFPFLLQIMVANSALHVYNISRGDPADYPDQQELFRARDSRLLPYTTPRSKYYQDALLAKQEALSMLGQFITLVDASNFDLVLAAILLFVNYDLIESGKDQWKPHIEGARKMIGLLDDASYQPLVISRVRTYLLSDFLVFYILGSTFRFSSLPQLFPASVDLEPILQYAETNNYLSCPAPLLRIMLQSFTLPDLANSFEEPDHQCLDKVKEFLELALAFDPGEWLRNFRPASPKDDLNKRLYVAAAHRCAVCIYIARFLPSTSPLLDPDSGVAVISLTGLATEIVYQLSHLTPKDTLFKSISWPLFLAGAEAEDYAQRAWIMSTLDSFYSVLRWGYIKNAKRVLEAIWMYKGEGATCWVTEVKRMGTEMLIA